jgi:hypothetical protein
MIEVSGSLEISSISKWFKYRDLVWPDMKSSSGIQLSLKSVLGLTGAWLVWAAARWIASNRMEMWD